MTNHSNYFMFKSYITVQDCCYDYDL